MMITQFTVGASHTINLGNYESIRVEANIVFSIQEGDDYVKARTEAQATLRTLLEDTYRCQRTKVGAKK